MSGSLRETIYRIQNFKLSDWQINICEDYKKFLENDLALKDFEKSLEEFSKLKISKPFRREISVYGFPFLCAVDCAAKTIHVGSRRLARELYLIELCEKENVLIEGLKEHVAVISQLDSRFFLSEWDWITQTQNLADWNNQKRWESVDEGAKLKLKSLVTHVHNYRPSLFERLSDWGLGLTAQYALLRIHLLKFLALLPSLDHDKQGFEVKRNLIESLRRLRDDNRKLRFKSVTVSGAVPLPRKYILLVKITYNFFKFLPAKLLAQVVRSLVKKMARRFIAGESIASSDKTLSHLHQTNRTATLDQLGELVVSEKEADEYLSKVLSIIHGLKIHIQTGERNEAGILKAHVSIKVSALASDFRAHAFDYTYNLVAPRLKKILIEANREQVFVNIDAEHYHYRDLVLKIYSKVLLETPELKEWRDTGIVVQAYLRDAAIHFKDILSLAEKRQLLMPIRLVKGAYWDAETIEAEVHSHHAPQFLNKEETDLHFRQIAELALRHGNLIQLAVGSHNLQDHCFVEVLRDLHYPESPVIEHQCLHMTYEALSVGLSKMGWPVRNYMPIGNLLVGMAYLVRRIMENSSQVGILTIMRSHNHALALKNPIETHHERFQSGELNRDSLETRLSPSFKNATPARLFVEEERESFMNSLSERIQKIETQQEEFQSSSELKVYSGSRPDLIVGTVKTSTKEEASHLAEVFYKTMKSNEWSEKPLTERAGVILKAADILWQQRYELTALIVLESSKSWSEAFADVDEAIDFLNFYVREEAKWSQYAARGVSVAIAPWNFPLAIACGMSVAPLIAGNPVILKPAEQTPLVAQRLIDILHLAGVPKSALGIIHGEGSTVGAALVESEFVSTIIFTGSKEVGQWIYSQASSQLVKHPILESYIPKKVITEMGGKNAIIITNNCEQDETIAGILYGSFGHAGQKCSACSRVLVDSEVKDSLLERLVKASRDLKVGSALEPENYINPLVGIDDQKRVQEIVKSCIEEAQSFGGKVWLDRSQEVSASSAVGPVLIELPAERAMNPDSWAQKEIFGPVVHIICFKNLDQAIEIFNSTPFALTGAIYGQSQDDIDYLVKDLQCGNLYINRPNTGARVAIEPFGGFKLSGTGPKAGGIDYLSEFHLIGFTAVTQSSLTMNWSKGSGYQYRTPLKSMLSQSGRLVRWLKFMDKLITHYERLTQRISEVEKNVLKDLMLWGEKEFARYIEMDHLNQPIPGQMNFNRKNMTKESQLLVVSDHHPNLHSLIRFACSLLNGTGVAVVCCTDESYIVWSEILTHSWNSGFSSNNAEIYKTNQTELADILKDPKLSMLYLSGDISFYKDILPEVLSLETLKTQMRGLYHDQSHPEWNQWSAWFDQLGHTRSFAINTMRHGAPLEIGL
jgi:RHH-type transcriptional regulator, proline utilization regulon repressor / proline dehydrogenase / delta 1-pyrroline-5-carboxylate dehydrogenase